MTIKVFCDFDGTITEGDNIVSLINQFAPPSIRPIKDEVLNGTISIRKGVETMFSTIPSAYQKDMTEYILSNTIIRDGFHDFVQFLDSEDYELTIVSGGLDFFVYPILADYLPIEQIVCNRTDFSGETVKIHWEHSCDEQCENDCGLCKPSVMRRLSSAEDKIIVIGDSVTDLQIAKQADFIFARDFLKEKCEELSLPYEPFNDFYDILQSLTKKVI
ncbi:2-hydroxy-3-keto-5-methylthiopentenyl-1-phosphate phosphatase [Bacillus sp. RG28]|uniref:2-hydroxy-3-keto-5-methylthiopentenyl-1-phosphate phosphatase n=1 Tax=Gottfriedia endophytica TaxID=2820819 RepID=A0A940NR02_9BACI|nr:2-hydroxy-3-keto-5-methylthiopentenyl-1-phosphate phosphatase [Gottfriedia endophytica]MBP0725963.1 2-hydroxy-3-keto-5-methylthiopentenyl-1-phosphate phosphatase [Gottfriedia endophytica]